MPPTPAAGQSSPVVAESTGLSVTNTISGGSSSLGGLALLAHAAPH